MTNRRRLFIAASLAVGISGCDQGTKIHALATLTDTFDAVTTIGQHIERFMTYDHPSPTRVIAVIPGFWEHRYVENPGSAFSVWSGPASTAGRWGLLLVRSAIAAFLLFSLLRTRSVLATVGVAAVLGGAVGNLIDGLRFGYVIDFIHWHWGDAFSWPVFNVADAGISIGIACLLLESLLSSPRRLGAA